MKFLAVVEKAFAEFVGSTKRMQVLPHMPPERRQFVLDVSGLSYLCYNKQLKLFKLATHYRIDTQLVDQEPHRSVQLHRRLDTRIPNPVLSALIPSSTPNAPNLGKLGDLKNPKVSVVSTTSGSASSGSPWRPLVTPSPKPTTPGTTALPGPSSVGENTPAAGSGSSLGGWSSIVSPQPQRVGVATVTKPSGLAGNGNERLALAAARPGSGLLRPKSSGGVSSRPSSTVQESAAAAVDEHVRENWEDD